MVKELKALPLSYPRYVNDSPLQLLLLIKKKKKKLNTELTIKTKSF